MAEEPIDIAGLIAIYVARLRRAGIDPQEVILFGSHARGEAGPDSDIDLVVVSTDLARWPALERLELLSRLTAGMGAPMEVLGYTPDEVRNAGNGSILWAEIARDGRQVLAA